jgi:hypothetical protein
MNTPNDFDVALLPPLSGSALVRAAKKVQRLANEFQAADAELKRQMEARYGDHDEMPDPIVEVTQYGGRGGAITLRWLDEEMAAAGFPPNKEMADR